MTRTIQDVMNELIQPVGTLQNTVDTLKFGSAATEVKGIATAFMPTYWVIKQAISMGANLLITHEGLFYSHHDNTDFLENNPVYVEKKRLIEESGISIFRCHDYIHRYQPDGIMAGLVEALAWGNYVEQHQPTATILSIPDMAAEEIAKYIKEMLGIEYIRIAGNASATCKRIGLLAGYRGGGNLAIPLFETENLDLIIYGEGPEWETPEYVRDAVNLDKQKTLIVLGHAESEEAGMKFLAGKIKKLFPDVPVCHIPERPVFKVI